MTHRARRTAALLVGAVTTLLAAGLAAVPATLATGAPCEVRYRVTTEWGGGSTTEVTVTNNGSTAVDGWALGWSFPADQRVTDAWNATLTQAGAAVTAVNVAYNRTIPAGGSTSFGFNATHSGGNTTPTAFTLNGTPCGGTSPTTTTTSPTTTTTTPPPVAENLALGKPATASSAESTALAAAQAVDGDPGTRWGSAYSDPQWLQVDLGAVHPIAQVTLRWEAAYARAFTVQASADGTTWTTLHSTTTGAGGTQELGVTGSGRYVRVTGTTRYNTAWGYSLYELEVYRTPPPPGPGPSCGQAPADAGANSKARNLLCYLRTHSYISGQTDVPDAERVQSMTGRYPAIVAFDFMEYTRGSVQTQSVIDWFRARKGIVTFQWHWYCPRGGNYAAPCDFVPDLTNPSSKLRQDVELVVRELKKLGDAGIPVLFRPLHESNNNYMWWTKKGPDAYKQLWRLVFDRAQAAGVDNVLWVFNGMASGQSTPLSTWYPGDAYADLVTSDYFQSSSDFTTAKAVGNGKTVAVAETFSPLDPSSEPPWSYSVVWASRDWAASGKDVPALWRRAMADPRTISIDQLPDITAW
ncbi:hypothetical protein GCM10010492_58240 [Saccharothrix mutabilis subsp. mutabilis]|uniref:Uncharacterized protein n=1 Tax=Saccharothrix mutabilis subsp. mutabilis TaxID=66855 RepID=A0ABP3E293_9PSEU